MPHSSPSVRVRRAAVVLALAALATAAAPALATWEKPVVVREQPLETASFLYSCTSEAGQVCPPIDHVMGRFRMTGPRTGVGVVTLPELYVRDSEGAAAPPGAVPSDDNEFIYDVAERLYGVTLRDGRWTLESLDAFGSLETDGAPALDVDAAGTATLVYYKHVEGERESRILVRDNVGGVWSAPTRLDGPSVGEDSGGALRLAVAPNGDASVFFTDWVCPDGAAYCQTVPDWTVQRRAGTWLPGRAVLQEARPPGVTDTALAADGSAWFVWSRFVPGSNPDQLQLELVGRSLAGGALGTPVAGPAGSMRALHTVPGTPGSALVVYDRFATPNRALDAATFDGTQWSPVTGLSTTRGGDDFFHLEGTAGDADLFYVEGGWPPVANLRTGDGDLDPDGRRIQWRHHGPAGWTPAQPVDGGLAAPAPPSALGPDDVAAGGGTVAFAAGALSAAGGRDQDRVYATTLAPGGPGPTVPIDNGTGGWTHTIAVDRWAGGSGAALFTQLGADGNVRLYGVEDLQATPPLRRAPFGRLLCTDERSQLAGCVTEKLDVVRAEATPPKVQRDGALLVSGRALERVGAATGGGARAAASARMRALKSGSVRVAVQRRLRRGRCAWWNASKRRFLQRSCSRPLFAKTRVRKGRFALRLPKLGRQNGSVTVWTRATTTRRKQQLFRLGKSKRTVTVRAPRRR